jgi:hypothetical protein
MTKISFLFLSFRVRERVVRNKSRNAPSLRSCQLLVVIYNTSKMKETFKKKILVMKIVTCLSASQPVAGSKTKRIM